MIKYRYRLVNTTYRKNVNLTDYGFGIEAAIRNALPMARNIQVNNDYYSFELSKKANRRQLIKLGRTVVKVHSDFIGYLKIVIYKVSKVSKQLFRRF